MNILRYLAPAIIFSAISSAAFAQTSAPLTREDAATIVKETLLKDPEIIMSALEEMRADKAEKLKKDSLQAINENKDLITNNPDSPSIGPKDADVVVTEFYDYHCGYCKHFLPVLTDLIKDDKKVRIVFKELPILSEDSVTAARAALAVNRINKAKFFDFHSALMTEKGTFTEERLLSIAKTVGIDSAKLKIEMAKPEITAILDANRKLADDLAIRGTPALIIGDRLVPGAMDLAEVKKQIAEVRSAKK